VRAGDAAGAEAALAEASRFDPGNPDIDELREELAATEE